MTGGKNGPLLMPLSFFSKIKSIVLAESHEQEEGVEGLRREVKGEESSGRGENNSLEKG